MFRPASRLVSSRATPAFWARPNARFLTTAPPHQKPRSWRSSAARWGVAIAGVYYYNTSTLFAEEPSQLLRDARLQHEDESLPTLASLSPSSRLQPPSSAVAPSAPPRPTASSPPSIDPKAPAPAPVHPQAAAEQQGPQDLEDDAASQGAFNEETGEINWDCPCLGGMAHGPCGEDFRAAFSCFVFSKEEPKGMDCIERFKGMQNCFREHPEIYGAELEDDEMEEGEEGLMEPPPPPPPTKPAGAAARDGIVAAAAAPTDHVDAAATLAAQSLSAASSSGETRSPAKSEEKVVGDMPETSPRQDAAPTKASAKDNSAAKSSAKFEEYPEEIVPKASHDARDAPAAPKEKTK